MQGSVLAPFPLSSSASQRGRAALPCHSFFRRDAHMHWKGTSGNLCQLAEKPLQHHRASPLWEFYHSALLLHQRDKTLAAGRCRAQVSSSPSQPLVMPEQPRWVLRHSHKGIRAEQGEAFSAAEHFWRWLCLKTLHLAGQALNFLFLRQLRMLLLARLPARHHPSKKLSLLRDGSSPICAYLNPQRFFSD